MDLNYSVNGANQNRLRLIGNILGASSSLSMLEDSAPNLFSIWCDDTKPASNCHVWWKNTSLSSVDEISAQAEKDMAENPLIDIMIFEHNTASLDNLMWFVLISKDNVVRTFQNETDVCQHLKELIARYESK
jgi:hypothetical protein